MHYTISPQDMKQLEADYMKEYSVPGALLMEHAAQGVVAAMLRHVPSTARALFLCGPGNNGGDGYAAARLWQAQGGHAMVWEMTASPSGDAMMNRRLALEAGVSFGNDLPAIIVGMVVAAVVGYLSIRFFLKLIANATLNGFALYVTVLGIVVIVLQAMGILSDPPAAQAALAVIRTLG